MPKKKKPRKKLYAPTPAKRPKMKKGLGRAGTRAGGMRKGVGRSGAAAARKAASKKKASSGKRQNIMGFETELAGGRALRESVSRAVHPPGWSGGDWVRREAIDKRMRKKSDALVSAAKRRIRAAKKRPAKPYKVKKKR
jgi:hypothetical protein